MAPKYMFDIFHQDKEELKKMLNTTSELANRYHIKLSQSMTINGKTPNTEITIGDQVLEKTSKIGLSVLI